MISSTYIVEILSKSDFLWLNLNIGAMSFFIFNIAKNMYYFVIFELYFRFN